MARKSELNNSTQTRWKQIFRFLQNALATHVDKEDKSTAPIQGTAYETRVTLINESGLYALILSSKLPQAKGFKRWVTISCDLTLCSLAVWAETSRPNQKGAAIVSLLTNCSYHTFIVCRECRSLASVPADSSPSESFSTRRINKKSWFRERYRAWLFWFFKMKSVLYLTFFSYLCSRF